MSIFSRLAGLLFCFSLLITSCSASRKAKADNTETASTTATELLSQKLGTAVPATANIQLAETVLEWKGTPYKYGGTTKAGVDCSGFIGQVYPAVYHIQVPRSAAEMHKKAQPIDDNNRQEGDLVFFSIGSTKPSHAGIYLWNGMFAHASTSKGVMLSSLEEAYWKKYFTGFGRLVPEKPVTRLP
ncbi:MAG TPA: C40 family peptidase [Phnomibacter sp.]|nr:C40 family peptidase [Phnomibacter sp.]